MPRKPYQISPLIQNALFKDTEREFGYKINNYKRYNDLSKDIESRCHSYLSPKTLSRVFPSGKNYSCSKQTLDVLSIYCGYSDVETYSKLYTREEVRITKEEFKILREIYDNKNYPEPLVYRDPVLFSISKIIVSKLRESTSDYLDMVNEYSDNPIAQGYFIEQSIDYDNLAIHYHSAIKTYLMHKSDDEAQVFGNTILYLNAFLIENAKQCHHYYNKVMTLGFNRDIHPFVIGRYYSTVLLHKKHFFKEDISPIIFEIMKIEKNLKKKGRVYMKFPGFHFMVCDSLIKCGEYSFADSLLDNAFNDYPDGHSDVDDGYYEALYLFKAICSHALGNSFERDKYYKLCKQNPFNFLSQKYYSIQLKILELHLPHKKIAKNQTLKDLEVLIHHTKFSYFQSVLNKWTR